MKTITYLRKIFVLPLRTILFVSGFVFLISCQKKEVVSVEQATPTGARKDVSLSHEQFAAAGIAVGKIESRVLSGTIALTGILDVPPQNAVNVTAPFGGFLRATQMLQGMKVVKGQSIATIENPEYIQLQQDYIDTHGQVDFLSAEYDRQVALAKENVNSQKTLQKSMADLNSMKARNNGLRAKLRMLQIDPDRLAPDAIRSTIELRSPINGYIAQIHSTVGSFVNATDVIFRIVDTDHLHAELTAFEKDIPGIRVGQKIRIMLSNSSEEKTAKVYLIGKEIGPDRTVRIHGHLDKSDPDLIPGMYLKALIETGGKSLPALPEEAVVNFEDRNYIFTQEPGDGYHFKLLEVITGVRENGFVEIKLSDDFSMTHTPVVVRGAYKLLSKIRNAEIE